MNLLAAAAVAAGVYWLARDKSVIGSGALVDPDAAAKADPRTTMGGPDATTVNGDGTVVNNVPATSASTEAAKTTTAIAPTAAPTGIKTAPAPTFPPPPVGSERFVASYPTSRLPVAPTTTQTAAELAVRSYAPRMVY